LLSAFDARFFIFITSISLIDAIIFALMKMQNMKPGENIFAAMASAFAATLSSFRYYVHAAAASFCRRKSDAD